MSIGMVHRRRRVWSVVVVLLLALCMTRQDLAAGTADQPGSTGNTQAEGRAGKSDERTPNSGLDNTPSGGTLPGGTVPGGSLPGGTVPGGTVPGGTLPGGTVPGGPVPGGPLPGGPVPGGTIPSKKLPGEDG